MRTVAISLHGGGMINLRGDYDLRTNEDGQVVLIVGKTEHVTKFRDERQLREAIDGKRERLEELERKAKEG